MEKNIEQRIALKFCFKAGMNATKSFEMLQKAYGESTMSRSQAFSWFGRFRAGNDSAEDGTRSGRPVSTRTDDNVARVAALLKKERRLSCRHVAEKLVLPRTIVHRIIRENLGKRKLCARFVPHALTREQREQRVAHAEDLLQMISDDPNFVRSIITGDETWCFAYDPETKRQSAEWCSKNSPRPTKLRFAKSRIKTMLITFFDAEGIVHKEFVPQGQTVNAQFYLLVLNRLMKRIQRVRPEFWKRRSFFLLHDNAPAHTAAVIVRFLAEKGVPVLNHPPYSPDLSPPRLFSIPQIKIGPQGRPLFHN